MNNDTLDLHQSILDELTNLTDKAKLLSSKESKYISDKCEEIKNMINKNIANAHQRYTRGDTLVNEEYLNAFDIHPGISGIGVLGNLQGMRMIDLLIASEGAVTDIHNAFKNPFMDYTPVKAFLDKLDDISIRREEEGKDPLVMVGFPTDSGLVLTVVPKAVAEKIADSVLNDINMPVKFRTMNTYERQSLHYLFLNGNVLPYGNAISFSKMIDIYNRIHAELYEGLN